MREIGAPHDVVFADLVQHLDADAIALISRIALPMPIVTRLHLEVQIFKLIFPLEIHVVEDVRNPADTTFADYQLELWVVLKYSGENNRHQGYRHIHLKAGDGRRKGGPANFTFELPEVRKRPAYSVHMYRQPRLFGDLPQGVPAWIPERRYIRPIRYVEAAQDAL